MLGTDILLRIADWLLGSGEEMHAAWYLDGLKLALEEFFTDPTTSNEVQSAITAEELAAWTSAAQRWHFLPCQVLCISPYLIPPYFCTMRFCRT